MQTLFNSPANFEITSGDGDMKTMLCLVFFFFSFSVLVGTIEIITRYIQFKTLGYEKWLLFKSALANTDIFFFVLAQRGGYRKRTSDSIDIPSHTVAANDTNTNICMKDLRRRCVCVCEMLAHGVRFAPD